MILEHINSYVCESLRNLFKDQNQRTKATNKSTDWLLLLHLQDSLVRRKYLFYARCRFLPGTQLVRLLRPMECCCCIRARTTLECTRDQVERPLYMGGPFFLRMHYISSVKFTPWITERETDRLPLSERVLRNTNVYIYMYVRMCVYIYIFFFHFFILITMSKAEEFVFSFLSRRVEGREREVSLLLFCSLFLSFLLLFSIDISYHRKETKILTSQSMGIIMIELRT